MKISSNMVLKAVSLLWTLGLALRDGELSDEELTEVGGKLTALVATLEEVL